MTNCFNPKVTVADAALPIVNKIIDKFTTTLDNNGFPKYSNLFRYLNEDFKSDDDFTSFKYRASIFIIDWFNNNYKYDTDSLVFDNVYSRFIDNLNLKTISPNVKHINGLPTYAINNTVKSFGKLVANSIDDIKNNVARNSTAGYSIKDAIIEFYVSTINSESKGIRTPYQDIIANTTLIDLQSKDSIVYNTLTKFLLKEYGMSISNTVPDKTDLSYLDSNFEGDDISTEIPMSFGYSDKYFTNIALDSMDNEFKQAISSIVKFKQDSKSDTYIPNYMSVSQTVSVLINLHRNDKTHADFISTLASASIKNAEYTDLYNLFQSDIESDILFVQKYITIFSKSIVSTNHTIISKDKSVSHKILNIASKSESIGFYKFREAINNDAIVNEISKYSSYDITPVVAVSIIKELGLVSKNKEIPFELVTSNVTNAIRKLIQYSNMNGSERNKPDIYNRMMAYSIPIMKFLNEHNLNTISLTYINEKGETVYSPTDECYVSKFTKGIIQYPIMQDGKIIDGEINETRLMDSFASIIKDPILRSHPLLFSNANNASVNAIFSETDTGDIIINNNAKEVLFRILNFKRETGFSIEGNNKAVKTYSYKDIYGPRSFEYHALNMLNGIYTLPTSDSTSSYSIDIPTNLSQSDIRESLIGLVNYEKEVYLYGVNLNKTGVRQNTIKWGVEDSVPTGEGFKFKETRYDRFIDGSYKAYSFIDFIIETYTSDTNTPITSAQDLYNLAVNDIDAFNNIFNRSNIEMYIDAFMEYQYMEDNSSFNKLITASAKVNFTPSKSEFKDSMFNAYLSEFIYSNLISNLFTGSQIEYPNSTDINKRILAQVRKSKTTISNPKFNGDHRIIIAKDINIQSPVYTKLLETVPSLKYIANTHNATDGISYITDTSIVNILKNRGTYNKYKPVIDAIERGEIINPTEYNTLIEQIKSFGYARRLQSDFIRNNSGDNTLTSYQFKDSTVILFKNQIKGTEFEKLYNVLVDNNIDQLSFKSAMKVGYAPNITIANEDGTINLSELESIIENDTLSDYVVNLKQSDLGIQQETVSHIVDKDTIVGSQFIKKIISDLDLLNKLYYLNGDYVDGQHIYDSIETVLETRIHKEFDKLMYEFGVLTEDGDISFVTGDTSITGKFKVDIDKFKEVINNIAKSEDVGINIEHIIGSNLVAGDLVLSLPIIYNTFENLLVGRINRILRMELPGTHVTIVPDIFRDTISSDNTANKSISVNDSDAPVNGVQYTTEFLNEVKTNRNGSYRLHEENGYDSNGQLINYAEIVINPYTSDIFKHIIKTRSIETNGITSIETYIDTDMIDPKCLEMIAIRIPTDSKASMVMCKIVGFATDGASKAIFPTGLINRTGWDFDIDTVYTYIRHSMYKSNRIVPITKSNQPTSDIERFRAYLNELDRNWQNKVCRSLFTKDNAIIINPLLKQVYSFIKNLPDTTQIINEYADISKYMFSSDIAIEDTNVIKSKFERYIDHINTINYYGGIVSKWIDNQINVQNKEASVSFTSTEIDNIKGNIFILFDSIFASKKLQSELDKALTKFKDNSNDPNEVLSFKNRIVYADSLIELVDSFRRLYDSAIDDKLNTSNLRRTFDSYNDYYKEPTTVLDNDLFDLYQSVLTSEYHAYERNRSNSSEELMAASNIILKYSSPELKLNFNDPFVRATFQEGNMSVGENKGISVNIDGVVAVYQSANAKFTKPIVRKLTKHELPRIEKDGVMIPIDMTIANANSYFGKGNYTINYDESGKFESIVVRSYNIANNIHNTKKTIVGLPIASHIAEASPAIFDAVNRPFGLNINTYSINLFRILAMSNITEWDGKGNNYWLYSMAIVNHPLIINLTKTAISKGTSLKIEVDKYIDLNYSNEDVYSVLSTSDILNNYDTDDINYSLLLTVKNALEIANDFTNVGQTLKTEKRIKGAYSTINRESRIINTLLNPNKLGIVRTEDNFKSIQNDTFVKSIISKSINNKDYIYKELYDHLLTIDSFEKASTFIIENPNIFKLISDGIVLNDNSNFITSLFPKLFKSDAKSVIPYIEANYVYAHNVFGKMYSDIFIQHTDAFNDIVKTVAYKSNKYFSENVFKQLRDGLTNYSIHNALISDPNFSDLDIDIPTKENLLGLNVSKESINIAKEVYYKLRDIKQSIIDNNSNMGLVTEFDTDLISKFRSLSVANKIKITRSIFDNIIDTEHFLHSNNLSIEKSYTGVDYLRYSTDNKDSIDNHIISFEESLTSQNIFIADVARDIILHNITLNGFNFGLNIGKIIPVSFFYNTYANNYGHPVECLNSLNTVSLQIDHTNISEFEDNYYRQNAGTNIVPNVSKKNRVFNNKHNLYSMNIRTHAKSDIIPIYLVNPKSLFNNSRNLYTSDFVNIKGITYKRYTVSQLLDYNIDINNGMTSIRSLVNTVPNIKELIDTESESITFANQYVYIPVGRLMKNEYGEQSVIPSNNICRTNSNGDLAPIKTVDIIYSFIQNGFIEYTDVVNNGVVSAVPVSMSISNAIKKVSAELIDNDSETNVDTQADISDIEDFEDVQYVLSDDDLIDATQDDISEDAYNTFDVTDTKIRLLSASNEIITDIEKAAVQLRMYGDSTPDINNAIKAIRKLKYNSRDKDTADYAYHSIKSIVDYYETILAEIPVISENIAKMSKDTTLFEHVDTDKFLAYSRLLNRASLFIKLINKINNLDTEGLSHLGRGFVKVNLNGEYVIVTNADAFDSVKSQFEDVPEDHIINDIEEYLNIQRTAFKEYLKDLIKDEVNDNKLFNINYLNLTYYMSKQSIQHIIDNVDSDYFEFTYYTDRDGVNHNFATVDLIDNVNTEYASLLEDTTETVYASIVDRIDTLKDTLSEYSKYIAIIDYNQKRYAGNVVQMQSRLNGELHKLIVDDLVKNNMEVTEDNIQLSYKDLTTAVDEYYRTNDFNVSNVNLGMRWFGTPFITTNIDIDNISRQFFILRSVNRDYYTSLNKQYTDLLKQYDISPKDTNLFKNGKLLTKYNYEIITANRNKFYTELSTAVKAKHKAKKYKEANAIRKTAFTEFITTTYSIDSLDAIKLNDTLQLVRKEYSDGISSVDLINILNQTELDNSNITFINELEYNEHRRSNNFDKYQYVEVTGIYNITSDYKVYAKFEYNDATLDNDFKACSSNEQAFLSELETLFVNGIKHADKFATYEKGDIPFVHKHTTKDDAKSFIGYKPVSTVGTWYDIDGNIHFKAHIKDVFNVGRYPKFTIPTDVMVDQDIDFDRYVIEYFKKWYISLDKSQRATVIKEDDITLEHIDAYNDLVVSQNKAYQIENQDYDLDKIMTMFTARSERINTANDMDVIYNASNLRNSVTSANDKAMIDKVLTNIYNQSTIKTGWDQTINVTMRVSSISFMWFNYLSGAKNVMTGTLHMIEEASKNGEFAMKDLKKGVSLFFDNIVPNINSLKDNPKGNKTVALFNFFDDHYEDTRDISVNQNGISKVLSWADKIGYAPNQMGETLMQYSMVFANANSHRVYNGKIYSFNELSRHIYETKLQTVLTSDQKHEFEAYKTIMNNKRKRATSYQSTINDDIWTFFRTKAIHNKLSNDQTIAIKQIETEVASLKESFTKLPSVYDILKTDDDNVVTIDTRNGKPVVSNKEFALFMRKIGAINQTMHGIYNKMDANALQDTTVGNLVFQFRKWMYPTWSRYFGRHFLKNSPNEIANMIETPIFKPVFDLIKTAFNPRDMNMDQEGVKLSSIPIENSMRNMATNFLDTVTHLKRYYNYLPVHEKAAMNRALKQMTIFTILSVGTSLLIGGLKDRDDKEKAMLMHTMAYVLNGVFNEWSSTVPVYGWYTEIAQTRDKLFVSEDVFTNLGKLLRYSAQSLMYSEDSEEYKKLIYRSGSRKGQHKAKVALYKLIPILKQVEKQMNVESYMKFYSITNPFIHD